MANRINEGHTILVVNDLLWQLADEIVSERNKARFIGEAEAIARSLGFEETEAGEIETGRFLTKLANELRRRRKAYERRREVMGN